MKRFSIWLRENKQWNEEGIGRFRKPVTHTVSPQHTVHVHPPTGKTPSVTPKPSGTLDPRLGQTLDYKPSPTSTVDYVPREKQDTDYDYHDHPVVNRLLNIVKNDIDALTWDYGKDSVETAIAGALESAPMMKAQCDRLTGCWKAFKAALYKELREGQIPWWGPPRSGPPNPVIYDVALSRLNDLEKVFSEIEKLCKECEKDEINQLFLQFMQEYSKTMPGIKQFIERMRKNTPRR